MAKKKKNDQLGVIGIFSAILRNVSQQRSLAKKRNKKQSKRDKAAQKKLDAARKAQQPKDKRTPEEIRKSIDSTRTELVSAVETIKIDLSLPTKARYYRDVIAARLPADWRGEPQATIAAASVLLSGIGAVALAAVAGAKSGSTSAGD